MNPKVENPNMDKAVKALYHQNRGGSGTRTRACPGGGGWFAGGICGCRVGCGPAEKDHGDECCCARDGEAAESELKT